jgi:hypothetical protein
MVTYRWLDGNEAVDLINPLIERRNAQNTSDFSWALLNGATSFAVGAFEDDFLIGFICMQMFPFIGPMWCDSFSRNGEISKRLTEEMRAVMAKMTARGCAVICESPVTERMCRAVGMTKVSYPVYIGSAEGIQK